MIPRKLLKYFVFSIFLCLCEVYCDEKSSLTFVIDDTYSMSNDIAQVRISANAIFDTVVNSNMSQIEDFVLVTFNDPGIILRTVTRDREEFKRALSSIIVNGGGDCPEYSMSGIINGITNSRPGSTMYVFTDASAKDLFLYKEVKNMAIKKQIQVVFVLTGLCRSENDPDYKVYQKLADDTLGQLFKLNHTDVLDIIEYVKENLKRRRTIVGTGTFPPGPHTLNITDKGDIKNMIVSATGNNIATKIIKPDGSIADTKIIVDKPRVSIKKVMEPKPPGKYTIKINSDSESRVVVSATSEVNFQHGFSTFQPSSIKETSTTPLPDVKSHITIKLTDGSIDLKTVQIQDMHNNVLKEVPLTALNEMEKLYTTELEELPKTIFRIAITGYDPDTNATITRVGSPITSQAPVAAKNKAPKVSVSGPSKIKADLDKPVQLKCNVNGFPRPDIMWVNADSGEELPATVLVVDIPDGFISILDIDEVVTTTNYQCKANNFLGSDDTTVSVENTRPYFNVLKTPIDTFMKYNEKGELHCKVDANPPAAITWYKDSKPLLVNENIELSDNNSILTIKEMHTSDNGNYVCEMRNKYERKIKMAKVTITGTYAPVINTSITAVSISPDSDAVINCNIIQGYPKPLITWEFSDDFSGEEKTLDEWKDKEVITIRHVNNMTTGTYSCVAINEVGQAYHEVKLTIEYPPNIEEDINEMRVREADSVTMACNVKGKPDPVVVWYKDNVPMTRKDNIYIYKNHNIKITVGLDDSGTYTCNATNKLGTASRTVKVDVYVPVTIMLPNVTKMDIHEGATLDLPCRAKGSPMPDTEWTYFSFNSTVPPKPLMKSHGSSVMKLRDIRTEEEGYYTCTASNSVGSVNASYEIHVLAPPMIDNIYLDKTFKFVEGDLVAMIKCKASGNPPPTISWVKDGYWVAAGEHFTLENETIIIKNITEDAEGVYVCEAKNHLGFERDVYKVIVSKAPQPGHPTSTINIDEGNTIAVRCDVPHKRTDQLRWYKNGALIQKGELTLGNVKMTDAGLYTCRVSDFARSTSGNTLVRVGIKPKFANDYQENIEYVESNPMVLNCVATGDPIPKVTWWHNGELMNVTQNYHYFDMEVGTQGQYVCEARNEFGSVTRPFNVITKDCLIDIKKQPSKLQPLMISPKLNWPQNTVKNGFMSIPKNEYVILKCPNRFKSSPRSYDIAFCEGGTKFKIRGKTYEYSNIECTEKVVHSVERTGESCFTGNTEMLRVIFTIRSQTIEAYEVCLDLDNNKPLYTTLRMGNSVADVDYVATEWSDDDTINLNLDDAYKCNRQNSVTSSVLGKWFHRTDDCCFDKRMLVSPKDLFPGVAQRAAYSHLNVVPHWSTCTVESNWNDVEQRVRSLAKTTYSELVVSTGVAEDLTLPDFYRSERDIFIMDNDSNRQPVPKYIWKVVQDPETKSSLVIIQVNVPDLLNSEAAAYVKCRDICNTTKWMKGSSWYDVTRGFTYCCTLKDFEDSFGYSDVFLPFHKVLNDVSLIPEYSLT